VIRRYFAAEQADIEELEAARDPITRQMEEYEEEYGGEDGLLTEARNDKGKLTAKGVKDRIKAIKGDKDASDERQVLETYLGYVELESDANKAVKEATKALDAAVVKKYGDLTAEDTKVLVVNDKWLARMAADVQSELDRVSQALTGRIRQLADRYAAPLASVAAEVEAISARVEAHLQKMGGAWN
jgi:type I restriction enzyme M protein